MLNNVPKRPRVCRGENRSIAIQVANKIRYQIPNTPEARFMFAVFEQAVKDLYTDSGLARRSAARYLKSRMVHVELCDVDVEWVRLQLKIAGVELRDD